MHFDRGRVQGHRFDLDADDLIVLQLREYPIQHAVLRPAVHPRINGVPVAEPLGQTAPFAALLGHIQDRVQHPQIGQAHIAALNRQAVLDPAVLRFVDFHARCAQYLTQLMISVNTP